ncbi:MAG: hypothetical protein H7070_04880 [Saprospiraceae bacterium]|nr:hypothetical protein [Pyrinomonadaceae bacterium]
MAGNALSDDPAVAASAITGLRGMGRVGLDALFTKYAAEIERFETTGVADANWHRIASALDAVAQQKDAYASRLYWYTDLETAKREADSKNKPILSLRLLGNLNEEFSCANSRLFRAVLYPNADVSKYLRENYVLHWRSVRPAPRITIDFGDGRKIERTLTGNSIHYILDENGAVIDALPGLYSPKVFLKYVTQGREVNSAAAGLPRTKPDLALMKYRKAGYDEIKAKRDKGVEISGVKLTEPEAGTTAILAAPRAMAKMAVVDEYSILRVFDDFAKFEPVINFADWNKLARLYSPSPKLDSNSEAFIRRQNAKTGLSEAEFTQLFAKLESFIALDTTRNDFVFHTKIYEWLNRDPTQTVEELNTRVYSDIFQTPNTDKWLGLYSSDVYTALDGNGIIK